MTHFEPDRIYLTEAGFKHLEAELRRLQTVERMRIAEAFRAHKEHGEFSAEDAELEILKATKRMSNRASKRYARFCRARRLCASRTSRPTMWDWLTCDD
jgi:transcription elongation GreA/GreB family factor